MEDKLVELGICGKPHGIKGGFSFHLHSGNESVLRVGDKVILFPKDDKSKVQKNGENFTIKSIAYGNKIIVYLDGITDRNIVEDMIPFTIHILRSMFPKASDDEFYVTDLIGAKAIDHVTGDEIGVIKKFYDNGAQIVFVVKCHGKDVDIPFIDQFFKEVDVENGIVKIIIPKVIG